MAWRIVTVKFPMELLKQIDELARRLGVKRSKIIRLAVEEYINGRIKCPLCGRMHYSKEGDL